MTTFWEELLHSAFVYWVCVAGSCDDAFPPCWDRPTRLAELVAKEAVPAAGKALLEHPLCQLWWLLWFLPTTLTAPHSRQSRGMNRRAVRRPHTHLRKPNRLTLLGKRMWQDHYEMQALVQLPGPAGWMRSQANPVSNYADPAELRAQMTVPIFKNPAPEHPTGSKQRVQLLLSCLLLFVLCQPTNEWGQPSASRRKFL